MGWKCVGITLAVMFLTFIAAYVSLLASANGGSSSYEYSYNSSTGASSEGDPMVALLVLLVYASLITLLVVLACMRCTLLKRHGRVDVDHCGSCLRAWCCMPCLAAQMMRWTDGRFEKYNTVDKTDIEMLGGNNPDKEML